MSSGFCGFSEKSSKNLSHWTFLPKIYKSNFILKLLCQTSK